MKTKDVVEFKGQGSHEVMRHGPQQRFMGTDMTMDEQINTRVAEGEVQKSKSSVRRSSL
jgi:hypothetical protein